MNDLKLMGRIAQMGELQTKGELKWIKFTLAVNRFVKGEQQTDFFPIAAFSKLAETISKYCEKGSQIVVEARLKMDKFKDKDGKEKSQLSIVADNIYFCGAIKKKEEKDVKDSEIEGFYEDELPY